MNQIKKMKQSYNDIAFVFSVWHSGQSFCKSNFIIVTSCHVDSHVDNLVRKADIRHDRFQCTTYRTNIKLF